VYKPPPDLREHLIATNRTCVFPGCARHARRCEMDHHRPFDDHGPTSDANMGPLCKRHHHLKHETKWRLHKHHDGYEWTDPTGHTYYSTPLEYPVTTEPITYDTLREAALQEEADAAEAAADHAAWTIDHAALTTRITTRRTAARGGTDPKPSVPSTTIDPADDPPPF
jgi:hypothetical protein